MFTVFFSVTGISIPGDFLWEYSSIGWRLVNGNVFVSPDYGLIVFEMSNP